MGVEDRIAAPFLTAEQLFSLPLSVVILSSGNQPTSGNVGSVRDANLWAAVGIESPAHCVQFYFHFRFPWPPFEFGQRPTSENVGQCRQCHIQVRPGRKCGVEVEIAWLSQSRSKFIAASVLPTAMLDFRVEDVGFGWHH